MNSAPIVSVIMSVHNGENFLESSIKSILNQTLTSLELIVVNDGSTDGTRRILDEIKDPRIHIIHQENSGLTKALNRAIAICRGEFIARQDDDDISLPSRLESQIAALREKPTAAFCACSATYISHDGQPLFDFRGPQSKRHAIQIYEQVDNPFVHGTLVFRRQVLKDLGGYDETFRVSQDMELTSRIIALHDFTSCSEILYLQRIHPSSISSRRWKQQLLNYFRFVTLVEDRFGINITSAKRASFVINLTMKYLIFSPFSPKTLYSYRIASLALQKGETLGGQKALRALLQESPLFIAGWFKYLKVFFR
jgi:glycosyltransferase involved in cell wall biosynthesis